MDHYIYMHGGFENETPNIPTNTIVRLDLTTVFKGNQMMLSKLEQFVGSSAQAGARSASANGSTKGGRRQAAEARLLQLEESPIMLRSRYLNLRSISEMDSVLR